MKSKREEKELHRERILDVCRGVPWNILQNNDLAGQGDGGGRGQVGGGGGWRLGKEFSENSKLNSWIPDSEDLVLWLDS